MFAFLRRLRKRTGEDLSEIRNYVRLDDQLCTGGQPRSGHLVVLRAEGVKAVINLRRPSEHDAAAEEADASSLGLRYFNIPVDFKQPTDDNATEFLSITDDPSNRPAFVHCAVAGRVAPFVMIRRVLRDHWTVESAEAEAARISDVNVPHLIAFAKKYLESHAAR
jgi:protein tyrosine phosphatase (PTP) superfamily phosphohydrolase (DUF442 family)